jgi:hypothetical protein
MAGGIFGDLPFEFNIKCVIFTVLVAGGYWFLPHKNLWVLLFLLWLPYIAMAWYDYYYRCEPSGKLKPTPLPFGRQLFLPFKPPDYQEEFQKLTDEQLGIMDTVDHIAGYSILILILVFFLFFKFK